VAATHLGPALQICILLFACVDVTQLAHAAQPLVTPEARARFERSMTDAMSRLNAFDGSAELTGRKP